MEGAGGKARTARGKPAGGWVLGRVAAAAASRTPVLRDRPEAAPYGLADERVRALWTTNRLFRTPSGRSGTPPRQQVDTGAGSVRADVVLTQGEVCRGKVTEWPNRADSGLAYWNTTNPRI